MSTTAVTNKKPSIISQIVAIVLIALGVLADQVSKIWVLDNLPGNERSVIDGVLALQYAENRNMAFGLGQVIPPEFKVPFLVALTGSLALVLLIWLFRSGGLWMRVGLMLTVSGAIGNIIDRIRLGFVVDFIRWHKWFQWPNFNVADSFICIGVGILMIVSFTAAEEGESNSTKTLKTPEAASPTATVFSEISTDPKVGGGAVSDVKKSPSPEDKKSKSGEKTSSEKNPVREKA